MKILHLIAIVATLTSALVQADSGNKTPIKPTLATSGLLSVATAQIAKLNVFNAAPLGGVSCNLTLSFVDDMGVVVGTPLTTAIDSGKGASLSFTATADQLLRAQLEIPNTFTPVPGKNQGNGCGSLLPTFEIGDLSGTQVLNTAFQGLPQPKK